MQEIYLAGGCLWSVQEFVKYIPGVLNTEAGRANGRSRTTQGPYDGYAECVRIEFDSATISVVELVQHLFEIIDPYSVNQQGPDVGEKYRTGVYSQNKQHLQLVRQYIASRSDSARVALEVLPLTNFVASDELHQHHLSRYPQDHHLCAIPWALLHKYKNASE